MNLGPDMGHREVLTTTCSENRDDGYQEGCDDTYKGCGAVMKVVVITITNVVVSYVKMQ